MRFKSVLLSAALLVFGVGAANASSTWLGVNGGAGVPTGDYGDAASMGWQFGVTGTRMVNDQWGVGADVGYHMWNASDDLNAAVEASNGPGSEAKFNAVQATAHLLMSVPTQGSVNPYLQAGVGMYNVGFKIEGGTTDVDDSESKVGFNFGAGLNFASSGNTKWGVSGKFHVVPMDDPATDVNFASFGVNVLWGVGN